jgi:hypothetical protein
MYASSNVSTTGIELMAITTLMGSNIPLAPDPNFIPVPCNMCAALREPGTNYSRVKAYMADANRDRYCSVRCDFCGNEWSQYKSHSESIPMDTFQKSKTGE